MKSELTPIRGRISRLAAVISMAVMFGIGMVIAVASISGTTINVSSSTSPNGSRWPGYGATASPTKVSSFIGTIIRPAALTGTVNDWAPTDLDSATTIVVATSGTTILNGLAGGIDGRRLDLCNTGTFSLTLANEAAASTPADRFMLAGGNNWILGSTGNSCAGLIYDGTAARWKMNAKTGTTVPEVINTGALVESGTISPAAITGTVDNWTPTGGSTARTIYIATSAAVTLDGLEVGQVDGREVELHNISTNTVTFAGEALGSTAARRFTLPYATVLSPKTALRVRYYGTDSRWRVVGSAPMRADCAAGERLEWDGSAWQCKGVVSSNPDGVTSGVKYSTLTDSTNGVVYQNTDGGTTWWPRQIPVTAGSYLIDDLSKPWFAQTLIGAGTVSANGGTTNNDGFRWWSMSAAGTDGVAYYAGSGVAASAAVAGSGARWARVAVAIVTLSDGTNNVIVRAGMHSATSAIDPVDGIYLEYDFATHANHDWWLCAANNSTRTKVDTGIAAIAQNGTTSYTVLTIRVNAAGTSATATIDGVAAAAPVTTNLPATSRTFYPVSLLAYKQLGASLRTVAANFLESAVVYTTHRSE